MTYLEVLAREYWVTSQRICGRDVPLRLTAAFAFARSAARGAAPEPIRRRAAALLEKMPAVRPGDGGEAA